MLPPAESKLLEAAGKGEIATVGPTRPQAMSGENKIRAGFLRFLILGGDEGNAIHEKGIQVRGAWVDGDVDLEASRAAGPITLDSCYVNGNIILRDADLICIFVDDTFAKGLDADRIRCPGSVHINNGTSIDGLVSLGGAHIGGDLDCTGSSFQTADGDCLHCEGAEIRGSVFLGHEGGGPSFNAIGGIGFSNARIDGDVHCNGLQCRGPIWFLGAQIKGDLDLSLSSFTQGRERSEILLSRATIGGRLFFRKITGAVESITMRATIVGVLVDDMTSWKIADWLVLDRLRYDRFLDTEVTDARDVLIHHESPIDAKRRIDWLDRQRCEDLARDFKPQPWEQRVRVLREMGHQEGAKQVSIAKQRRVRKSECGPALWHWIYGLVSEYGYRPGRLVMWAAIVALAWSAMFKVAATVGVMAPTDWRVVGEEAYELCRPDRNGNWTVCPSLQRRGYSAFDPIIYSFDLILPVITPAITVWFQALSGMPFTAGKGRRYLRKISHCVSALCRCVMMGVSGYKARRKASFPAQS